MHVNNVKIYDLPESIVASGYPMLVEYLPEHVETIVESVRRYLEASLTTAGFKYEDVAKPHIDRAIKLANAKDGSGHRTFCSGILVSFDVTASNVWWMQFERYHFAQIISSQSKMHRLKQLSNMSTCVELLDEDSRARLDVDVQCYEDGEIDEENMIYSCPMGLQLTARVTTNYLQLRTIYIQRKNHKLKEWRDFCNWISTLPMANQLIIGKENEETKSN